MPSHDPQPGDSEAGASRLVGGPRRFRTKRPPCPCVPDRPVNTGTYGHSPDNPVHRLTCGQAGQGRSYTARRLPRGTRPPMPSSPVPAARCHYLLDLLAQVPDPRKRRGRRHALAGLLAVGIAAVIAGSRSFAAIGQWAADAGPSPCLTQAGSIRSSVPGSGPGPCRSGAASVANGRIRAASAPERAGNCGHERSPHGHRERPGLAPRGARTALLPQDASSVYDAYPGEFTEAGLGITAHMVRPVCAACAAMIRSCAPRGEPDRRTWASRRPWWTAVACV